MAIGTPEQNPFSHTPLPDFSQVTREIANSTQGAAKWALKNWKSLTTTAIVAAGGAYVIFHGDNGPQTTQEPTKASDKFNPTGSKESANIEGTTYTISKINPDAQDTSKKNYFDKTFRPDSGLYTDNSEFTPTPKPEPTATVTATPTESPTSTATSTIQPTPEGRIVRNSETKSLYEKGPSPVWVDKSWDEIRQEVGDKFLPTSPVDPVDSKGNPVKMEIQLQRNDDKDPEKITMIGYIYRSLETGTKVKAIIPGIVEDIFDMSDTKTPQIVGHMVYIRHASGAITVLYIHGGENLLVKKGEPVQQGQVIGEIGDQNLPHLLPWDLDIIFAPTASREDYPAYIKNYQNYWYAWPPVSAKE